jgi:hypothetical protein
LATYGAAEAAPFQNEFKLTHYVGLPAKRQRPDNPGPPGRTNASVPTQKIPPKDVVEIPFGASAAACWRGVLRRAKNALLWMTMFCTGTTENPGLALVGFVPVETLAVAVAASGEEFEFFDPLLGII